MKRIFNFPPKHTFQDDHSSTIVNRYGSWFIICLAVLYTIIFLVVGFALPYRLDQQADTIAGSIVGVIGSMFGLTAASYAFVWGELKSEGEKNIRLENILESYREKLWVLFVNTLRLTFIVIVFNLIILGLVQNITDPTLFYESEGIVNNETAVISSYLNEQHSLITLLLTVDLALSVIDILFMAKLNYDIFARQRSYSKIAEGMLNKINTYYKLDIPENFGNQMMGAANDHSDFESELNKIHYLELLINRILKNHESEGEVYQQKDKSDRLLKQIVTTRLNNSKPNWEYLANVNKKKLQNLNKQCSDAVEREKVWIKKDQEELKHMNPSSVGFTQAYKDLILYRNAKLVCFDSKVNAKMIKCTIKKRLLIFYMSHEKFDGMDLSNMSLSGADLSYSNFSNCNLKGVKLKGTNCRGTDFSNSRMPGIHFDDGRKLKNINKDDIIITQSDDKENKWDVYHGRQPTCLKEATFSNADLSRMTLLANGDVDKNSLFPFVTKQIPVVNETDPFSLCDVNFDKAKLFSSRFNNIDLSQSSIYQAQMFNSRLALVNAANVNFGETVLTFSHIEYSGFYNSNFRGAVLSDCNIYRCDFSDTNMSNTNFSNSRVYLCNFSNAICNNASFKNIVQRQEVGLKNNEKFSLSFRYATMIGADFSNSDLKTSDFSHTNAKDCNFTKSQILKANFFYTMLSSSIWNSTKVKNTKFNGAVMRDSVFIYVDFAACCFNNCDFSNSIVNSKFIGGKMNNVRFCNVNELNPKNFENITLNRVDFTGCGISKSDFPESVVLNSCIFDKDIKKGSGLNRRDRK